MPNLSGPNLDPITVKAIKQQEQADVIVSYEVAGRISLSKPQRKVRKYFNENKLKEIIQTLNTKKDFVIISFGKMTLFNYNKMEIIKLMNKLEKRFISYGFQTVVFHQETASGPYDLGERIRKTANKNTNSEKEN